MNLKRCHFAFIFLVLFFSCEVVLGQRLYANVADADPPGNFSGVFNKDNAAMANNEKATLTWLWFEPIKVELRLIFPQSIDGGITTFIRVDNSSLSRLSFTTETNETLNATTIFYNTETYISVTPTIPYNEVKITLNGSLINTTGIYYAFNGNDPADCGSPFAPKPLKPIVQPIN